MKSRLFRFKQFEVSHSRAALPVGVDGVLIGAWAELRGHKVLDVGTGCGVIALMIAQRYPEASVNAIDVHLPSVEEAAENFVHSPWSSRLKSFNKSFADILDEGTEYDLIVSNPPFFDSGVEIADTPRLAARHQGELSPASLIKGAPAILRSGGRLAIIVPAEMIGGLISLAKQCGLTPERVCLVRNHEGAPEKRALLQFVKVHSASGEADDSSSIKSASGKRECNADVEPDHLTMFVSGQDPTPEYRQLCGQFYLKF